MQKTIYLQGLKSFQLILKYSQNKKKKYRLSRIELFNYILAMNSLVDQAGYIYTYTYNHLNSNSNQHIINILNDSSKIINHFKLLNLPTQIHSSLRKNLSIKKFIDVMNKDKKTKNNKINLILLKKIGKDYQTKKFESQYLKKIIRK